MSDVTASKEVEEPENPNAIAAAAFGRQLDEITDALAILYIKNNASGRHKFNDKWPDIAQYVFGETLIKYDYEGTQDRAHRADLEAEADQRRVLLKATIREMTEKSVDSGVLQFEYVGQVIDQFGPDIAPYLYAEDIIERVRPGLLAKRKTEKEDGEKAISDASEQADEDIRIKERASHNPKESLYDDQKLSEAETDILSNSDDQYEAVKPVELSDSIETPREGIQEEVNLPGDEEVIAEQEQQQKIEEAEEERREEIRKADAPPPTAPDLSELDNIKPIETQSLIPEPNPAPPLTPPEQSSNPAPDIFSASEGSNPAPEIKAPELSNPAPELSNPAPDITKIQASNPAPDITESDSKSAPDLKDDAAPVVAPETFVQDEAQSKPVLPDVEKPAPTKRTLPEAKPSEIQKTEESPAPKEAAKDVKKSSAAAPSIFSAKPAAKPKAKPKGFYMDIFNGLAKEAK